nr:uncharacterized protein LOC117863625 [Setaria viridis]
MITSAETLVVAPLPTAEEVDVQVATEAGAAAASLLVEAMQTAQVTLVDPQQSAVAQADDETLTLPSAEVTGTLNTPPNQPLVILREAGPSRAPIIVESSSDDPMVPAPESRVIVSQTQLEEIRFKEEQDTPNNSLFSFAVTLSDDEEGISPRIALGTRISSLAKTPQPTREEGPKYKFAKDGSTTPA